MAPSVIKSTLLGIMASVLVLGCGNTSPSGGHTTTGRKADTFTLSGPTLTVMMKQGDRETTTIAVDRGKDFKQQLKLTAEAPKGLTVELSKTTLAPTDPDELSLTIEAAKDAPISDHVVTVTATPESGSATSLEVKVAVEARK